MTIEQYKAVYARKKKENAKIASFSLFKALMNEASYQIRQKRVSPVNALKYIELVWQEVAKDNSELKPTGLKDLASKNSELLKELL